MIPQRVKLKGFLSYKDEQEIAFDGSSLWMLSGLNGSGKSTVFDAVTYALFGHHRGGSQHAEELINHESDRAAVEFDFTLDGQGYQAYRTLQFTKLGRSKATQQLYKRLPDGSKQAIEGTDQKRGYDAWVSDNIGLSYSTFTSSVLLLQGKAEKLLDATATGRFEVLAGIVDLERYQRLHKQADEQRKELKEKVEGLSKHLAQLPEVTPLELVEAEGFIADAEEARQKAQAEVERLLDLHGQAKRWGELQSQLATARDRWEEACRLLDDADAIEKDVKRLRELREVLPKVQTVIEQRGEIEKSLAKTAELEKHHLHLRDQLERHDHALEQTRKKRESLEAFIKDEEQQHRKVNAQLRQAAARLRTLEEHERQEGELARLRDALSRLPDDPAATLGKEQEEHDRLSALAQAVPLLARIQSQRGELRQAQERERAAVHTMNELKAKGEKLNADLAGLKPKVDEAERARREADDQATEARTLMEQARQHLEEITSISGAKVCRHCGQELTPGHLREETTRRRKALGAAQARHKEAVTKQAQAQEEERLLREQLAHAEKQLQDAREKYRDQRKEAEQARLDVQRLQRECAAVYRELAEPFRSQVSPSEPGDWLTTTYPSADDLAAARLQASGLAAVRQRLAEAQRMHNRWNELKGQEKAAEQNLNRLAKELPAERQAVRSEHVRLESEEQALQRSLAARRTEFADAQKQMDRLQKDREQAVRQLAEADGRLRTEEATRTLCEHALNRALKELPPEWQAQVGHVGLTGHYKWTTELKELAARQTDERGRQLEQARANADILRQDVEALEEQQKQFPEEARQDPERVRLAVLAARDALKARDDELLQARQRHHNLVECRRQREQLEADCLQAEKELKHAELLAKLLGRDRLQLHLVRQAERQVVDHANAVLDRLSGGKLYLRLCGEAGGEGASAKALEMEAHNRATGEKPINVAFLSGSQKFRVAVSLALGIGQYASKQHRPIESVIIDEGFGCLDKDGRQAMIQELQNLRDHMRCILLVSHQEEFADAFENGYRFELDNGATRVTRFQK